MTDDIERLKEKTSRDDRLSEGTDRNGEKKDGIQEEDETVYAPIEEVVLRENAKEGVKTLREQTERDSRLSDSDEPDEVELSECSDIFDEAPVDDPYCGNCEHVTFRKRDGSPSPHCSLLDLKTRLESGMVCEKYEPQTGPGD